MKGTGEVALALVLASVSVLVLGLIGVMNTGLSGLVAGALLALLPAPVYVALALWVDRYEKEPLSMLGLAFLWGASGAVFLSFLINTAIEALLSASFEPEAAELATAVVSAPVVEEIAKGVALFLLFVWTRHEFDNLVDGVVYATMVGLGFATIENVAYYGEAFAHGPESSRIVFLVRGVMSPFAHPFFTAMTGVGVGLAAESTHRLVKLLAPVLGLGTAVFVHAAWNLSAGYADAFFWIYLLIMLPAFLGMIGLVLWAQARERRVIRGHLLLAGDAQLPLPAERVEELCRWGGRTRALWRAWRRAGRRGFREEERVHQVASELAFHRWRRRRGLSRGSAEADAAYEMEHLAALAGLCQTQG